MSRFPNKARVCFIGDSITHNNIHVSHIVNFYRKNFADSKVEFYNCGISGGTLTTTLNCFDEDILIYNPTHAVIMIGINDATLNALNDASETKHQTLSNAFENYKSNLHKLCTRLENMGVEITLCTQTPYAEYMDSDEPTLHGSTDIMLGYANFVKEYAKEKGYAVCDYNSYFTRIMQTETIHNLDRVHPTPRGQYYMAKCFLEFQGYDLGEETPLPDDIQKWQDTVFTLRNTIAAEHLILNDDFTSTQEQRIKGIKDYLDNEQEGPCVPYFKELAKQYQTSKPKQQENIKFVMDFMKNQ